MLEKKHDIWFSEFHSEDVRFSLGLQETLYEEKTPFQHIKFMRNATFGNFFTLDGYIMITEKDEFIYHDMICHPAMAVKPAIKRVLIIGGGDGGTAREVAKYPMIEKIDLVEIDERVVRLCQKYLPQTAAVFDQESRLELHFCDGLQFVNNAKDSAYDLILVDSTDPIGPGKRLFTVDFYRNCFRVLSQEGILINQHEGAFYDTDICEMKRVHNILKEVFPIAKVYGFNIPSYASGYWYFGFASKKLDPLLDIKSQKWQSLRIPTKYYNLELHRGSFALPNYVQEILTQ
ncbi:MAG: polyamine aminopropyltransferase [Bacillota bacterium]|jgi:spermidine synthase